MVHGFGLTKCTIMYYAISTRPEEENKMKHIRRYGLSNTWKAHKSYVPSDYARVVLYEMGSRNCV